METAKGPALHWSYYSYGGLAFLAATPLAIYNLKGLGIGFPKAVLIWTTTIYGGLIGARLLYVLYASDSISTLSPFDFIAFWHGGLAWLGAPIGATLFVILVSSLIKVPISITLSACMPAAALGHGLSRVACLSAGCCFGRSTNLPWGIYSERQRDYLHPTPIYSMLFELALFLLLQLQWKRDVNRKTIFIQYFLLLGLHRFIVEFYRGDSLPLRIIFVDLQFFQFIAGCYAFLATILLLYFKDYLTHKKYVVLPCVVLLTLATLQLSFNFKQGSTRELMGVAADPSSHMQNKQPHRSNNIESIRTSNWSNEENDSVQLLLCRDALRSEAEEYAQAKTNIGLRTDVISWPYPPEPPEIERTIRTYSRDLRGILFVGSLCTDCGNDADCGNDVDRSLPAIVTSRSFGGIHRTFHSDSSYGRGLGRDSNSIPVGRLPFNSKRQLQNYKLRAYPFIKTVETKQVVSDTIVWISPQTDFDGIQNAENFLYMKYGLSSNVQLHPSSSFLGRRDWLHIFDNESWDWFLTIGHGSSEYIEVNTLANEQIAVEDFIDTRNSRADRNRGHFWILGCESALVETCETNIAHSAICSDFGPISVFGSQSKTYPATTYLILQTVLESMLEISKTDKELTLADIVLAIENKARAFETYSFRDIAALEYDALQVILDSTGETLHEEVPGLFSTEVESYLLYGDPDLIFPNLVR